MGKINIGRLIMIKEKKIVIVIGWSIAIFLTFLACAFYWVTFNNSYGDGFSNI